MRTKIKHYLLICLGWLFVLTGAVGAVLPLLPTTPFLILALACFAESSPRFHRMLLHHKWFGPPLAQWEKTHTIRRAVKKKVILLITLTFGLSIAVLWGRPGLQLMLVGLCLILLWFVSRLKESEQLPR
ncbi:YbaN family protein [Methylophaga sp. OBS4]|uniref:YbaN family protein n=1 Tax=Methylophaga sp. OBS4 TaxID=2991935 RepID=UPI00224CA9BC|nr:YbaN family protein [Methylophaga sp. OBS4]MCX4187414.1 YbaN family protein [Methylophaga sp. OBS4]